MKVKYFNEAEVPLAEKILFFAEAAAPLNSQSRLNADKENKCQTIYKEKKKAVQWVFNLTSPMLLTSRTSSFRGFN